MSKHLFHNTLLLVKCSLYAKHVLLRDLLLRLCINLSESCFRARGICVSGSVLRQSGCTLRSIALRLQNFIHMLSFFTRSVSSCTILNSLRDKFALLQTHCTEFFHLFFELDHFPLRRVNPIFCFQLFNLVTKLLHLNSHPDNLWWTLRHLAKRFHLLRISVLH